MRRMVPCPNCGRLTEFAPANRWRPFCSERCKTSDLGAWASDRYAIPGAPQDDTSSDQDEVGAGEPVRRPRPA